MSDHAAFRRIYEDTYPAVLAYALRRTETPADADDVAAEVFFSSPGAGWMPCRMATVSCRGCTGWLGEQSPTRRAPNAVAIGWACALARYPSTCPMENLLATMVARSIAWLLRWRPSNLLTRRSCAWRHGKD
ncbi:MAG TPA: hypothetical protein VGV93_05885 [Acidimicrobiales bacterium]|nr:hypothetical protein [Acidimicrobiales bacterium]